MRPHEVKLIREAVEAARKFAHENPLEDCDVADIDELCDSVEQELSRPLPNAQSVATFLDSLLKSLRLQRHAGKIVPQLYDAMRSAGIEPGA